MPRVAQTAGEYLCARAGQRQLEAALRGYRLGYRATGYRRQNVGFGVNQRVNHSAKRLIRCYVGCYGALLQRQKTPAGVLTVAC